MKRETRRWKTRALRAERALRELRADVKRAGARAMASVHRPALEDTENEDN